MWRRLGLFTLVLLPALHEAGENVSTNRTTAGQALDWTLAALQEGEKLDADPQRRLARQTLAQIQKNYSKNNILVAELGIVLADETDPAKLRQGLWQIARTLSFQPILEGSLPVGFPGPAPLGEIVVKDYPAYRRATTPNQNDTTAFFTLFSHIQRKQIAMTVPVEMNIKSSLKDATMTETMSFLYRSPELGELVEKENGVTVMDMPAMTVVSVGLQDRPSKIQLQRYEQALRDWVQANRPETVEQIGPPRLLGYNSPMIPPEKRYFELQLPLAQSKAASASSNP